MNDVTQPSDARTEETGRRRDRRNKREETEKGLVRN